MLYTSTSALFASARHASRAASCFRSRTIERLLRFALRKMWPMPALRKGHAERITSPPGGSTLTTSAPKSARICVAYGPITTVVRSRTRTPARGPLISFRLDVRQLHKLRPVGDFGLDESAELGRIHRRYIHADGGEPLLDLGLYERLHVGLVQPLHDRLRQLRRRDEREPGDHLVARQLLGDGRLVGRERAPLAGSDAEATQLAALLLRERVGEVDE